MLRTGEIRRIVEEKGYAGYLRIQARLLGLTEEGRVPEGPDGRPLLESHVTVDGGGKLPRKSPLQFSFRALWEGMVGPVEETLNVGEGRSGLIEDRRLFGAPESVRESAIASSAFASAVGQLTALQVIAGYEAPGFVGDQLVTRMPSKLRGERMVGFTSLQGPKPVGEGDSYQESTFGEKYVTTTETKRGRLLSITEEAVYFDQTGQILDHAMQLGRMSREERERRIIRGVADVASTERVYRPTGTATQLYSTGNANLLSTATPLVDWTDISEAMAYHAANVRDDRETDDTLGTQPITWRPTHVLTAMELAGQAARIFAATLLTDTSSAGGTTAPSAAILNVLGAGSLKSVASAYLDAAQGADQWDDASDWLIGDFPRQFAYKEVWPLQTFRAPAQNDEQFERDVLARFKVREYGDIFARDHRLVIKVNAV
jgi:hypothetical protein